jgi:hypothetical protein
MIKQSKQGPEERERDLTAGLLGPVRRTDTAVIILFIISDLLKQHSQSQGLLDHDGKQIKKY